MNPSNDSQHYYAHGKLMLTGEYFVLDGATALAIPTSFGQHLRIKKLSGNNNVLYWMALNSLKQPWLNLAFDKMTFKCINSESKEANTLSKILHEARLLNPSFLIDGQDTAIETYLEFPNEWGLGSSSTLIYCIATAAGVDGVTLLKNTIGGSGYDVACAGSTSPILYTITNDKSSYEPIPFSPPFQDKLYFAYTGQKQLSSTGIQYYRDTAKRKEDCVKWLNRITESIVQCQSLIKMKQLMEEHETIIAEELSLPKVKDRLFGDYWGAVKSLGAWGGDFVLMTNERSKQEFAEYLHSKGMNVYMSYEDILWKM